MFQLDTDFASVIVKSSLIGLENSPTIDAKNMNTNKKILVADPISPKGVDFLKQQGFDVVEAYGSTPEQVLELISDADGVIVRSETKITSEALACAKNLKAVGRAGVGVDNIDIPAATEKGVVVMNTPTGNTIATAELTFTHMMCGTRPIVQANNSIREGKWDRKSFKGGELFNKTLFILGMGRIGSEIAKRAKAFQMKVMAYDPFLTEARAASLGVELIRNLEDGLPLADYITVHMPLTPATKYMLDEKAFDKMKKGVRVFNCARGGIIKESALVEALKSGKVAAAGLDVYESEPFDKESPLRQFPNVVFTPHLGASTKEAQESCGIEVAQLISAAVRDGVIRNAVNAPSVNAETLAAVKPYVGLCEKLGTLIQQISPSKVQKLTVSFFGKLSQVDNKLLMLAIQKGYLRQIADNANDVNAPSKLKHLGIDFESVNSSSETDYAELVEVTSVCEKGEVRSVAGTVMGKGMSPRVVKIDGHDVEISAKNTVLLLMNKDKPGIVGSIATILGRHGCNIANMTVSRDASSGAALSVYELDEHPAAEVVSEIQTLDSVDRVRVVDFA